MLVSIITVGLEFRMKFCLMNTTFLLHIFFDVKMGYLTLKSLWENRNHISVQGSGMLPDFIK